MDMTEIFLQTILMMMTCFLRVRPDMRTSLKKAEVEMAGYQRFPTLLRALIIDSSSIRLRYDSVNNIC